MGQPLVVRAVVRDRKPPRAGEGQGEKQEVDARTTEALRAPFCKHYCWWGPPSLTDSPLLFPREQGGGACSPTPGL